MPLIKQLTATLAVVFSSATALAETYLIDVRTAAEYAQDHAEHAQLIAYDEIDQKIVTLTADKDDEIYVYCRSGRRSGIAAEVLTNLGYNNVIDLGTLQNAKQADIPGLSSE